MTVIREPLYLPSYQFGDDPNRDAIFLSRIFRQISVWAQSVDEESNYLAKVTDQAITNTTTLQDDPYLHADLETNKAYKFEFYLIYDSAAGGTPDLKVQMVGPTDATIHWFAGGVNDTDAAIGADALTGASTQAYGTAVARRVARGEGVVITAGHAGKLRLRSAQNTANATATTVRAGSHLAVRRVI